MSHSIIIIGAKLDCLKEQAEQFLASIESLRTVAVNADNALATLDRETAEAVESELENAQELLTNMCQIAEITDLKGDLDAQKADLEATLPPA